MAIKQSNKGIRIAIWGVGAMGSLFGGYLSRFADVMMVGNWREQIDTVREQGLLIHHLDGSAQRYFPKITSNVSEIGGVDLAIVLVKSAQTERAVGQIEQVLQPDGLAITLQNGLGNIEILRRVLGSERATGGVTSQGATMLQPGEVRHAGSSMTSIAELPTRANLLAQFVDLLQAAALPVELLESTDGLIWGKLAVNVAINPLTALLNVPNGQLAEDNELARLMVLAATEVVHIAEAKGIVLPYADLSAHLIAVAQATGRNRSSMLQDVGRGASTEIDAICGAVVEQGRLAGVATPINEALYGLIKARESGLVMDREDVFDALSLVA